MNLYTQLCTRLPTLKNYLIDDTDEKTLRSLQDYLFTLDSTISILSVVEDLMPPGFIKVWEFPRASRSMVCNVYSLYRNVLQGKKSTFNTTFSIDYTEYDAYSDILNGLFNKPDRRVKRRPLSGGKVVGHHKTWKIYDKESIEYVINTCVRVHYEQWKKATTDERVILDIENVIFNHILYKLPEQIRLEAIAFMEKLYEDDLSKMQDALSCSVQELLSEVKLVLDRKIFGNESLLKSRIAERSEDNIPERPMSDHVHWDAPSKRDMLKAILNSGKTHESYLMFIIKELSLTPQACDFLRNYTMHRKAFKNDDVNMIFQALTEPINNSKASNIIEKALEIGVFQTLDTCFIDVLKYKFGLDNGLSNEQKMVVDMVFDTQHSSTLYLLGQCNVHKKMLNSDVYLDTEEESLIIN